MVQYHENGELKHQGWFIRDLPDSLQQSWYSNGQLSEQGMYVEGRKDSLWQYWYEDGTPMLNEMWEDSIVLVLNAWSPEGDSTVIDGNGVLTTLLW